MVLYFFVFKQKTAYEMRISDWSSDVCSSDLACAAAVLAGRAGKGAGGDRVTACDAALQGKIISGQIAWNHIGYHCEPHAHLGGLFRAVPGPHQPSAIDDPQQKSQTQRQYPRALGVSRSRGGTSEAGPRPPRITIPPLSAHPLTSRPAPPNQPGTT